MIDKMKLFGFGMFLVLLLGIVIPYVLAQEEMPEEPVPITTTTLKIVTTTTITTTTMKPTTTTMVMPDDAVEAISIVNTKVIDIYSKIKHADIKVDFFGTEYQAGDAGTVWLQLLRNYQPINNGTCFVDMYYPNKIQMLDNELMFYLDGSDGLYYRDFTVPSTVGVYMLSASCYLPATAWYDVFDDYSLIESYANVTVIGGKVQFADYCGNTALACDNFMSSSTCVVQQGCAWMHKDVWWNSSFQYRKSILISNVTSDLSNYQVNMTVDTSQLISQGKMRGDCGDVRFTWYNSSSSSEISISFWNETACNTSSTNYWIKVPLLEDNLVATVYMYYGNSSVGVLSGWTPSFTAVNYISAGTFSWTCLAGITSFQAEVWGGGGGGGGTSSSSYSAGGAGGGAYSKKSGINVTAGSNYTVVVGYAGWGVNGGDGVSGGSSYFVDNITVLAVGGQYGHVAAVGGGAGGAGGAAASGVGDIKTSGGNGAQIYVANNIGGGGGGSGGTASNGNSASGQAGASAVAGGGVGGNGGSVHSSGSAPVSASGGGGGGAAHGGASYSGGSGWQGKVVLSYLVPDSSLLRIVGSEEIYFYCNGTVFSCSYFNASACSGQKNCLWINHTSGYVRSFPVSLNYGGRWIDFSADYVQPNNSNISFSLLNVANGTICSGLGNVMGCAGTDSPIKLDAVLAKLNEVANLSDDDEDEWGYEGVGCNPSTIGNYVDENWSSSASSGSSCTVYVNYTKPVNAVSVLWEIKAGVANGWVYAYCWNYSSVNWSDMLYSFPVSSTTIYNIIIPNECLSGSKLVTMTYGGTPSGVSSLYEEQAIWTLAGSGSPELDLWWITWGNQTGETEQIRASSEVHVSLASNVVVNNSAIGDEVIIKMLANARILNDRIVNFHNHQYCINNMTLQHNITYDYCVSGNCNVMKDIMNEACQYGCDYDNSQCKPSPVVAFIMLVVIAVIFGCVAWVVSRYL